MVFTRLHRYFPIKALFLAGITAGFVSAVFAQTYTGELSNRVTINMGETPWKFSRTDPYSSTPSAKDSTYPGDASWEKVGIPHCFNAKDSWLNVSTGIPAPYASIISGTAWYRRNFTVDAQYTGRRIELEFQGVNIGCAVYINGKFKPNISRVAQPGEVTHVSGHLPFVIDITNDITFGAQNVIAVRVSNNTSNSFFKNPVIGTKIDWAMGLGGIQRPVYLHITDKVHVPLNVYSNTRRWGTYVATTAATEASATVRMQTKVYNDDSQSKPVVVITKIVDAQNNVVATQTSASQAIAAGANYLFDQTATITKPQLWYPNNNPNGKPYMHKVYHIVQVNGQTVDVFKSPLGIRVITWDKDFAYINGKKHLFWGFGSRCEYPGFGSAVPEEQQWRDIKLLSECGGSMLRPGHCPVPTTTVEACDAYGVGLFENTMDNEWAIKGEPALTYKDEFHRDCIIRDRNHPSLAVWELNNGNTISSTPGLIKRLCDSIVVHDHLTPRAASTRDGSDYWPTEPGKLINGSLKVYNRESTLLPGWGAESWLTGNTRFSYGYEVKFTDNYINETNKVLSTNGCGLAHWMFMECGGEGDYQSILDPAYGKTVMKTLSCSAVDQNRIPKLMYNVYKNALWIPFAVRPGVALQSHWNYSAGTQTVTAYSNCPSVELFLNGTKIGVQTPNVTTKKCQWANVAWAAGTLRAEGRNATGTVVCFDERKTAGAPARIVLTMEQAVARPDNGEVFRIRANGTDAAFILATIVDAAGNWCPLATNNITFKATGQGVYVGSSNYITDLSKPLMYHCPGDPELAAEGGMMKVGVRATFTPGTVTVEASAAGLTSPLPLTFQTYDPATPPIVMARPAGIATRTPAAIESKTFKIVGSTIAIPREFYGKTVSIKTYDLSGKLLRNEIVEPKSSFIVKNSINSTGMHIVQCREMNARVNK